MKEHLRQQQCRFITQEDVENVKNFQTDRQTDAIQNVIRLAHSRKRDRGLAEPSSRFRPEPKYS